MGRGRLSEASLYTKEARDIPFDEGGGVDSGRTVTIPVSRTLDRFRKELTKQWDTGHAPWKVWRET